MKKTLLFISFILTALPVISQSTIDPLDWYKGVSKDSIKRYKIYFLSGDSTHVDTTLTLKNYFKHNLLRKDDILLHRYANQGENYNWLSYQEQASLVPEIGFRTKHFNYLKIDDIKYYDVATPYTELALNTGYYRGQFLDALFAVNIKPNLNFSIGYKGLRSVGRYRSSLSSHGNMQATINYKTKDGNYHLKTHFTYQDLSNEESGGVENDTLFTSGNPDYSQRTAFAMNLTNAESFLKGKRFFINHFYKLPFEISSLGGKAFVEHIGTAETKYFRYTDEVEENKYFFGSEVFNLSETLDSTNYRFIQNDFLFGVRGTENRSFLKVGLGHNYMDYGYDTIKVVSDNNVIPAYIKGSTVSLKAQGRIFPLSNLDIEANASYNFSGKYIDAFELFGKANLNIKQKHNVGASLGLYSFYPEMQFWLYQSNYKSYNYFNNLEKQYKLDFKIYFESDSWFDSYLRFVNHKEYTFFDSVNPDVKLPEEADFPYNSVNPVKTVQYNSDVNILEIGLHKDFRFGVFGFDTRTVYQKVMSGDEVFRTPEIVTRNNIYYSDDWFKHALVVQTGFGVKYFTEYSSFQYNPLNGMYFRPNEDLKIGNYPLFNFFFNARIRTARIYFEVENITAPLNEDANYFSAPHYPGNDLRIRFGFVWNFFG